MNIINWISKKKLAIITTIVGAIIGWLYWNFIGCDSGTCSITSVWYRITAYGAILGWFVGDYANEKINNSNNKNR